MTAEPEPFPPDFGIAIVAHNSRAALPATIDAILATGCAPRSISVIDVASDDGTREWLATSHPSIAVWRLATNAGPNPGRNEAIRRSTHPYVLVMDSDVLLTNTVVHRLRPAMDGSAVAVAAPLVLHAASPDLIQYAGGGLHFICEAVNTWKDRPVSARGDADTEVGAASGNAMLLNRAAAHRVGLFDERYFMGKEDGDFMHRLRIAGFRIIEVGNAHVLHHSRPRTTWLFTYQIRNRWHFILRNYQLRTIVLLLPAFAVHELLQLGVLTLGGHLGSWARALVGLCRLAPALPRDRAIVRGYRTRGDAGLLRDDPLIVRSDLAGGGESRLKRAYDGWLRGYWRIVRPLVQS
jgi:GT2 family glycosyltransferase